LPAFISGFNAQQANKQAKTPLVDPVQKRLLGNPRKNQTKESHLLILITKQSPTNKHVEVTQSIHPNAFFGFIVTLTVNATQIE
jgi:hypothetical protein